MLFCLSVVNFFLLLDSIPLNYWNECLEHWFFFSPILFWYAFEGCKSPLTTTLVASYVFLYTIFIISLQNNFNYYCDSFFDLWVIWKSVSSFPVYGQFLVTCLLMIPSLILLWLKSILTMISVLWNTVSLSFDPFLTYCLL